MKKTVSIPGIGDIAKLNALKTSFNLALQCPASDLEERSFDENSKRVLPVHWARFTFKVGA